MSVNSLKDGLVDNFKDYESSNDFIHVVTRLNNVRYAIEEFFGEKKIKVDLEPEHYGLLHLTITYPLSVRHYILQIEMLDNKYPIKLSSTHVPINWVCNNIDELDSNLVFFFQNPYVKDFIYSIKTLSRWTA